MKKTLLAVTLVAVSGIASAAQGDITVKAGVSLVDPTSNESTLANGTLKARVGSDTKPTLAIEYGLGNNLSAELLLATPFRHKVSITDTTGAYVADASFRQLPPTVSLKYTFPAVYGVTTYVGAGVNYTKTWGEKINLAGAKLTAGDSVGVAANIGASYPINQNVAVALDVRWADIDSTLKLNGDKIGSLHVDPFVYGLGVTYKF